MSGHVLLNLINELLEKIRCETLPILSIIDFSPSSLINSVYHMTVLNTFFFFFYRLKSYYFNRKHYVVTDGIMTLRASNQVLCNVWSYDFYDMTLSTE